MVKFILIKSPDEWATTKQACRDELVVYLFFSPIYIYIYIYIYIAHELCGTLQSLLVFLLSSTFTTDVQVYCTVYIHLINQARGPYWGEYRPEVLTVYIYIYIYIYIYRVYTN